MRTIRSGRTYGSVVPKSVLLPDEILLCVFEQLGDPFNLARVVNVSRQWHQVARSYQHLWRDAIGLDMGRFEYNGKTISPTRTRHLIDQLCARSGGKLDRLALMLPLPSQYGGESVRNVEDVEYILQLLPTLHLKELWFEGVSWSDGRLGGSAPTCERSAGYNNTLSKRLTSLLVASLHRCEHLTKLYIDAYGSMDAYGSIDGHHLTRSLAGTPLSTCRLKELSLRIRSIGTLLDDESFCKMLQSATHIKVQSGSYNRDIEELRLEHPDCFLSEHLLRLLRSASATLEHLEVSGVNVPDLLPPPPTMDQRPAADQRPRIFLPCLRSLSFNADFDEPDENAMPFCLVCPALVRVGLHSTHLLPLLKAVLGSQETPIEALILTMATDPHGKSQLPAFVKLLSDQCGSTLQRLTVWRDAEALLKELTRYPTMNFDTLTVVDWNLDCDALVNLVQSRLLDAVQRPICDLAFPFRDGSSDDGGDEDQRRTEIDWLLSHVAQVDLYNWGRKRFCSKRLDMEDPDMRHFMERRPDFFLSRL